ncbi:MAG: hypothetical protein HY289_08935 [Planctomycetes bacterium]|nr:hypothetical protein [Planctomycetota bacterium]
MTKKILALALALAGLAIPAGFAPALMIAPPPGPIRIVNSDAVFVGRVLEMEPVDVDAKRFPGAKDTVKFRIAVVKVNQAIYGLKDEKTIRVGFVPFVAPKPGQPIISGGGRSPQLTVGQDGLFMISKHVDGKFYLAPNYGYFVASQDKKIDEEIKTAKKVVTIMGNLKAALEAKDADDRLLAAAVAVGKYRTQKAPFPNTEEPIDADESKAILKVIISAKWVQPKVFGETNPQTLFFQLGINQKDGWTPPRMTKSPEELRLAVEAWYRDHGDYRIKRFVPKAEK